MLLSNNCKRKRLSMFLKSLFGLLLSTAIALASQPVTVLLHDGSEIKGSFADGGPDSIRVEVAGQTITLQVKSIESVKFEGPAKADTPSSLSGRPLFPSRCNRSTFRPRLRLLFV